MLTVLMIIGAINLLSLGALVALVFLAPKGYQTIEGYRDGEPEQGQSIEPCDVRLNHLGIITDEEEAQAAKIFAATPAHSVT